MPTRLGRLPSRARLLVLPVAAVAVPAAAHAQAAVRIEQDHPASTYSGHWGRHTLTIEATGTRHESARGSWIWVDAFDIVQ
jgi:hypothetical protein